MKLSQSFFYGMLIFAISAAPALAGVLSFNDRATWEAAVGPRDFEEDFEGFLADIDFSNSSTSAPNGFSLSHEGPEVFRNAIDVSPLDFANEGNGTSGVSTFVDGDGGDEVTITPDQDLSAFGVDISNAASGEVASITTVGPGGTNLLTLSLTNGVDDFFGFQTTGGDRIVHVLLQGLTDGNVGGGEGFYMDNIAGVFVPEPTTLGLAGLGLLGMGYFRGRRA